MGARSFRDLVVWQKAIDLCTGIYKLTESFPKEERYRLIDQMRTAASSIHMNIAEGFGRWSPKDQAHFYEIAKTSGDELKGQLLQAKNLKFSSRTEELSALADEVCAMLYRLRQKVLERGFAR